MEGERLHDEAHEMYKRLKPKPNQLKMFKIYHSEDLAVLVTQLSAVGKQLTASQLRVTLLNWPAAGPIRAKARNGIICTTIPLGGWLRTSSVRKDVTDAGASAEKGRDAVIR
ncbi:hypothetical protein GJ744_000553 [Endocarpon pusillum]|uniref:Uncharacterized protein n=1 Tax=Endocarpon pusillum TaxID=364733 RepID=A0A8H7E050_9EURO|nr:hypothetical protein GJ744_000553 [Endocarpon pusillum]